MQCNIYQCAMNKKICFLLIYSFFFLKFYGQDITVEGLVTDSVTGEGLPYAALQIKGTTLGTATDADGHFSLNSATLL